MTNTYRAFIMVFIFSMAFSVVLRAEVKPAGWESAVPLLAKADIKAGQKSAHVCGSCHTFDKGEGNKTGPNLYNIVNSAHARAEKFEYSDVLKSMHDKKWTYEALDRFLFNTKDYARGSRMFFSGIKKTQERANIIAWLRTLSDKPAALPKN